MTELTIPYTSTTTPLPCPHCGRWATTIALFSDGNTIWRVQCSNDECPVFVMALGVSEEEAVSNWNHRPETTHE